MSELATAAAQRLITLGRIVGVFGVKGWVKVQSFTAPPQQIARYSPWQVKLPGQVLTLDPVTVRPHGKGLIARFAECSSREQAEGYRGGEIQVQRAQFTDDLDEGEYYWADLIGLRVVTLDGTELGVVDHLLETGANDVLVVQGERERLIPYLWGSAVRAVDLSAGTLQVDWDPEF